MLEGSFSPDPLLLIAEVKDLDAYIEVIETNVDIGPSDTLTELGTIILRILYIAFFSLSNHFSNIHIKKN